jgi:hypothetical protein
MSSPNCPKSISARATSTRYFQTTNQTPKTTRDCWWSKQGMCSFKPFGLRQRCQIVTISKCNCRSCAIGFTRCQSSSAAVARGGPHRFILLSTSPAPSSAHFSDRTYPRAMFAQRDADTCEDNAHGHRQMLDFKGFSTRGISFAKDYDSNARRP